MPGLFGSVDYFCQTSTLSEKISSVISAKNCQVTLKMKKGKSAGPMLNEFPSEVLAMIFARMPFGDRLRMTRVCHRWNQLIFRFFGDQILLKMDGLRMTLSANRPGFLTERIYRNISLFLDKDLHGLESSFVRIHDKLVYLSVHVHECPSENLDELQQLLTKLINLKTLNIRLSEEDFKTISNTIFELTFVEGLRITFNRQVRCLRLLDGLHRMTNLRKLQLQAASFSYPRNFYIQTAPQVEQLVFGKILAANFRKYSLAFPNLKVLDIFSMKRSDELLADLTKSWPNLEVLTLRVNLGFLKDFTLGIFQKFSKLRKLSLLDVVEQLPEETTNYLRSLGDDQPHFSMLGVLLEIRTLQELHVDRNWTGSVPANPSCRLFINGVYHSQ